MRIARGKHYRLYNANNMDALKVIPDNSIDSIVTDPPYGLSAEPDVYEMVKQWYKTGHYYHHSKGGFMGKEWDAFVPQPAFWKECLRVLKPGGHVLSFFGSRTYDIGVLAMRMAGFEIRDSIQWIYGQGFPKSMNISKSIDKQLGAKRKVTKELKTNSGGFGHVNNANFEQGFRPNSYTGNKSDKSAKNVIQETLPSSEQAKQWDGWGTALKPAQEPIVLARKPFKGSVASTVLEHGTGGINIDGCRIGYSANNPPIPQLAQGKTKLVKKNVSMYSGNSLNKSKTEPTIGGSLDGRWPANVILTHDARCKMLGHKKIKGSKPVPNAKLHEHKYAGAKSKNKGIGYGKGRNGTMSKQLCDKDGNENIEHWECHPDCPIHIMDQQSGNRPGFSGGGATDNRKTGNEVIPSFNRKPSAQYLKNDSGGASRFFYCAKASKAEKNAGLEHFKHKSGAELTGRKEGSTGINSPAAGAGRVGGSKNTHPTVKPIKLMEYLIRLITPKNGIVLDPFMGTGTTGIAAYNKKCNFIGIEKEKEYAKIALARIKHHSNLPKPKVKKIGLFENADESP